MAKEYNISVPAHPSIYQPNDRDLDIYFCEPDSGINEETGLLLLINGFGANSNSNVYKKMRGNFSDQYNLITIQCDYFGIEFMGDSDDIRINEEYFNKLDDQLKIDLLSSKNSEDVMDWCKKNNIEQLIVDAILKEDLSDFNDMSIMQALDNITALFLVIAIIRDNGYKINGNKILCYGYSHGAYLSYLCNAFTGDFFSLIIDNSAWLFPKYIEMPRYLFSKKDNLMINIKFEYLINKIRYDKELLYLLSLYNKFESNCTIVSFQGDDDNLVHYIDKKNFCSNLKSCFFELIDQKKVDGKIFKSNKHGLGADFLLLFDYVMKKYNFNFKKDINFKYPEQTNFNTNMYKYIIDYSKEVPILTRTPTNNG
ncbi:DUF2920 family protein [Anaerophilus nitritogenes]|uniref:DUF2920 family protein n=1 Tax=Anaerophilus nitritogenes TaxID=2498136 RepID=UPI0013EA9905|nr:DUF2920 family protein [Anaerophilus nitritogenes]